MPKVVYQLVANYSLPPGGSDGEIVIFDAAGVERFRSPFSTCREGDRWRLAATRPVPVPFRGCYHSLYDVEGNVLIRSGRGDYPVSAGDIINFYIE